ncbi:MAG: hypothetical protein IVW54_21765 [Candidatus Binataceae bacterium]|nr:hypothetical protein [Candidatus Binataceae bacterium]
MNELAGPPVTDDSWLRASQVKVAPVVGSLVRLLALSAVAALPFHEVIWLVLE